MKKIDIIQFVPYFPPHRGGLESHAEEWAHWWMKKGYGNVINVTNDISQNYTDPSLEWIEKDGIRIGYRKSDMIHYLIPAFELIHNFPVPRFWTKQYRSVIRAIKEESSDIVITRTRFFLSSFFGGLWAKGHGKTWVHIEHGSDSVLLESKVKTKIADLYDSLLGRYCIRGADLVIGISQGVREFIQKRWNYQKEIPLIYRGLDFHPGKRERKKDNQLILGYIGRLVELKGVHHLLEAFLEFQKKETNSLLWIIGNGGKQAILERWVKSHHLEEKVRFYGELSRKKIAEEVLPNIDILVNPSYQEGLPTTVIEGLLSDCIVVATDVGGTREISIQDDLILIEKGKSDAIFGGLEKAKNTLATLRGISKKEGNLDRFKWETNINQYRKIFLTLSLGKK